MAPDRGDPQPTVPESPKDIYQRAEEIARTGVFDPDSFRGVGYVFYGRATVDNKPNVPVVIKSGSSKGILRMKHEVAIKGDKIDSSYEGKMFYFSITQTDGSDEYVSHGELPSSLGKVLSTITRDEKRFTAHRKKIENERAEDERVDARRRRRRL
ncbi:MAG TPA: hypothetical protein VNA13_01700 [Xanthomonadales bacterium]|nr:hypothetical protein [Xanthomonadales bacterium]